MNFGQAIEVMRQKMCVAREGWNGKGMWIAIQWRTPESAMTLPYIYMRTVSNDLVPWLASQSDMLADDWTVVISK